MIVANRVELERFQLARLPLGWFSFPENRLRPISEAGLECLCGGAEIAGEIPGRTERACAALARMHSRGDS